MGEVNLLRTRIANPNDFYDPSFTDYGVNLGENLREEMVEG